MKIKKLALLALILLHLWILAVTEYYDDLIVSVTSILIAAWLLSNCGVGTIDADYRGQIAVPLINLGKEPVTVTDGDKIAQLIVTNVTKCDLEPVTKLHKSLRGTGGFGSTGK